MIDSLYEELIALCEVRGEFDSEINLVIEKRIANIQAQINELEKETI